MVSRSAQYKYDTIYGYRLAKYRLFFSVTVFHYYTQRPALRIRQHNTLIKNGNELSLVYRSDHPIYYNFCSGNIYPIYC
jgi:hypothetical protein